jgi:hypothetical protein
MVLGIEPPLGCSFFLKTTSGAEAAVAEEKGKEEGVDQDAVPEYGSDFKGEQWAENKEDGAEEEDEEEDEEAEEEEEEEEDENADGDVGMLSTVGSTVAASAPVSCVSPHETGLRWEDEDVGMGRFLQL